MMLTLQPFEIYVETAVSILFCYFLDYVPDFSVILSHSNKKRINLSKKSLIKKPLKKAKLMLYCTKENKYQANCWESAAFRDAGLTGALNEMPSLFRL